MTTPSMARSPFEIQMNSRTIAEKEHRGVVPATNNAPAGLRTIIFGALSGEYCVLGLSCLFSANTKTTRSAEAHVADGIIIAPSILASDFSRLA
ncbi:MAG: hypothetical protein VX386_01310, partial [Pseudomonadota bacterium]|nr:hypothetical protein [Pseudomonadota bacterium]